LLGTRYGCTTGGGEHWRPEGVAVRQAARAMQAEGARYLVT